MTKQFALSCVTSLGLFLAASPALVSQVTTGQISGRITNANGRPVARARVILTAPELMRQRETQTDANGEWRANLLPVGNYTIKISADGYLGVTFSNIRIGVGAALRQDYVLKPVSVATETVEIVANDTTVIDKTDTKTSVNFTADQLSQLTGGRSFNGAADLTAGATWAPSGNPVLRGGQANSTLFRLDGADIKDSYQGQVDARWYVDDQIEDVAVVLSPLNARYGRTLGGALEVVTKSGGNEFSGSLRVSANRSNWGAEGRSYDNWTNDGLTDRAQNFTLAGPILKDRLWFSLGIIQEPQGVNNYRTANYIAERYRVTSRATNGPNSNGFHTGINSLLGYDSGPRDQNWPVSSTAAPQIQGYYFPVWDTGLQPRMSTSTASFYSAKVTYGVTENHKVTIGGQYQPWEFKGEGINFRDAQAGDNSYMAQGFNMGYSGILGTQTFLEFNFNRQKQTNSWNRSDTTVGAWGPVLELWTDDSSMSAPAWHYVGTFVGRGNYGVEERNNATGTINLNMFRDFWNMKHNIDVGVEYFQADKSNTLKSYGYPNVSLRVGGIYEKSDGDWLFPTLIWKGISMWGQSGSGNTGLAPVRWEYSGEAGVYKNVNTAVYFNDQMTINEHWNVMLGLRVDKTDAGNVDGSTVFSNTNISPRLVVTYDLKGDSEHVFKFNYSRMQIDYPITLTDRFTYNPNQKMLQTVWTGLPGQPDPGTVGDIQMGREMYGLRFVTLAQLLDRNNYGNPRSFGDSGQQYRKDKNLKPMVNDEFAVEYRRNYQGGSYIRLAYAFRVQSNLWAGSLNYNPENWVVLKDPTNSGLRPMYAQTQTYFNTTELWRDYHGLEFETYTRINSIFSWTLSYGYSRIRGNSEVGDSGSSFGDFSPPGYYSQKDYLDSAGVPMYQRSPSGALMNDAPHKIRTSILAVVPLGAKGAWISYSATFGYDSGSNWSTTYGSRAYGLQDIYNQYVGIANSDSSTPSPFAPPETWTKWYSARGAYHWNDDHWVDAQIAWEIPIYRKLRTMGNISIWNVFNMVYQRGYNNDFYPNPGGWYDDVMYLYADRYGKQWDEYGRRISMSGNRSVSLSIGLKF